MVTGRRALFWTIANVVMAVAFGFSVAVQWNDPDPLRWMAIYGAAVVACVLEVRRRTPPVVPAVIGAVALIWAATIAPRVLGHVGFGEMFAAFEMKNAGVEESREMYGLLLVALWTGAIGFAAWQRRPG